MPNGSGLCNSLIRSILITNEYDRTILVLDIRANENSSLSPNFLRVLPYFSLHPPGHRALLQCSIFPICVCYQGETGKECMVSCSSWNSRLQVFVFICGLFWNHLLFWHSDWFQIYKKPTSSISYRSIHVVSQVHVLIIVPYALWCILHDSFERLSNPAFGWDEKAGYLHAIACGWVPP